MILGLVGFAADTPDCLLKVGSRGLGLYQSLWPRQGLSLGTLLLLGLDQSCGLGDLVVIDVIDILPGPDPIHWLLVGLEPGPGLVLGLGLVLRHVHRGGHCLLPRRVGVGLLAVIRTAIATNLHLNVSV